MNTENSKKIYPFKFLDAYSKDDTELFFGRDDEIERLYELTFQSNLILIYGTSGTGKTSLIQCGLAKKFESYEWLPIFIRRNNNINTSINKALSVQEQSNQKEWLFKILNTQNESAPIKTPLAKAFQSIYLKHYRPIYLIFDQFEELYLLGDKAEQEQFVQTIQEILKLEQPIKIIISIREEYLGHLYEFEKAVPQLLRKKLRVEPMNLDKVRQVMQGVTTLEHSNIHIPPAEFDDLTEGIFNKIKGKDKEGNIKKGLTIPLPYFQVFLDKLYLKATNDKSRQADAIFTNERLAELGEISDVLRDFLDEQVQIISQTEKAGYSELTEENIWKILSPFVTLEGTKKPITKTELLDRLSFSAPAIEATLNAFTNGRIIRYTEEGERYEVAHDALALQIAAKRTDEEIALLEIKRLIDSQTELKEDARELFTEKQLNFIDTYWVKLQEENLIDDKGESLIAASRKKVEADKAILIAQEAAEKQRLIEQAEKDRKLREAAEKEKKRATWLSRIAIVIALFAIAASIFAWQQNNIAQEALTTANEATEKAEDEEQKANAAKIESDTAKQQAIRAAENARVQEEIAKNQKGIAESALTQAKAAQQKAILALNSIALTETRNGFSALEKWQLDRAEEHIRNAASSADKIVQEKAKNLLTEFVIIGLYRFKPSEWDKELTPLFAAFRQTNSGIVIDFEGEKGKPILEDDFNRAMQKALNGKKVEARRDLINAMRATLGNDLMKEVLNKYNF